jgi:catechol 2,3-dioxygenase-like lactoylglutathione lyase family enzyme
VSVADLERACDELRGRGIALLAEPREYPWGRSAYLRDPDGRLLELSQT